jgi:hypothetical protein
VGTVTRTEDAANEQPAAELATRDVQRAVAFDFGTARNTTVYLASYALDGDELGGTVEAPSGETLVTVFLRPASGDLKAAKKLKTPGDQVTVVVDTGGGARATTSGAKAKAQVLAFSDDEVCFTIDYHDDHQQVKGSVRAAVG